MNSLNDRRGTSECSRLVVRYFRSAYGRGEGLLQIRREFFCVMEGAVPTILVVPIAMVPTREVNERIPGR